MAQFLKHLLQRHKELTLVTLHQDSTSHSPALGEKETGESGVCCPANLTKSASSRFREKLYLPQIGFGLPQALFNSPTVVLQD